MKKTVALILGLTIASALTLQAQPGPRNGAGGPQNRRGAQGFPPPVAAVLDQDGDGALSANEIATVPTQLLKLDADNDGQLSAAEICPGGLGAGNQECPYGMSGQRRGKCGNGQAPLFVRLFDADTDGMLSAVEINNAPAVLRSLDTDADGAISNAELRVSAGCGQSQQCGQGMGRGRGQGGFGACGQPGAGAGQGNRWGRNAQAR